MANGITAEQAIEAIKDSKGFVTSIAKRLGCSRQHIYVLAEKYSTVKAAIEEEREGLKDFAESKLIQQIDAGNITAIIFYLKTQGKGRGYVERQELVSPDDKPFIVKVVYGDRNQRANDTSTPTTPETSPGD